MNLFLVGWSPSGDAAATRAQQALAAMLARLPFFDSERIESWQAPSGSAALACVGHEPERLGGVRYVDLDAAGMALFSGRPILWTGDGAADGRAALDPGFYRRPAIEWMDDLDGRCAAARYDDHEAVLEVYSDPLGAYPLYSGQLDGTRWISNSAELVRTALGTLELDQAVLASVLGSGFSISGDPIYSQVRRLSRGAVLHLRAKGSDTESTLLPIDRIASLVGTGFDPDRSARDLVAAAAALADWPGRPKLLQLSGGRDSRLVLAASLAAEAEFEVVTVGTTESPDVRVARDLSRRIGVRNRLLPPDPGGVLHRDTRGAAHAISLAAAGTFSLEDASGYPIAQSSGPLPLWLNGQGGEIARPYYHAANRKGRDGLVRELLGAVVPGGDLLSESGRERVRREVDRAVDHQLAGGVRPGDVADVFYLLNRMGTWAATGFGCVEYAKGDTVAPLWCSRMLRHELGPPAGERQRERFHAATLETLSPELAAVPYAEYAPLSSARSPEFAPVRDLVREAVTAQEAHPAWEVLDRGYVERLLDRDPGSLDDREYRQVWRLGTVFMGAHQEPDA